MKTKQYIILFFVALSLPLNIIAQKICDFESNDYKNIGIYDEWSDSPFNNNLLEGNVKVVKNNIKDDANSTEQIMAIQRSRYGSNIFGGKIILKEPFELTPNTKYVHVLINTPIESRIMLVGLGKRTDRTGQSDQVIQFHAIANNNIRANKWTDAVFSIKGNGGIMISSLVVVPHCESPHKLSKDFFAYIDEIEISDDTQPRFSDESYFVNFDKGMTLNRDDRHIDKVNLSGNNGGELSVDVPTTDDKLVYHDLSNKVGFAKPGETLTPSINYTGSWMHGYVYLDYNNDGEIVAEVNSDGNPAEKSEIVSYSYFKGKNSKGETLSTANPGVQPPTFTLPNDMEYGIYRLRYKVDWDNIDAGGNIESSNHIRNNGGGIVDVLLNVHKETSHIKITTRNGAILTGDGNFFEETDLPFGQSIEIKLKPEEGFKQDGIVIKHGYLDKEEYLHNNRQWKIETIPASGFVDNKFTIPAEYIDGDVEIIAEFAENNTAIETIDTEKTTFDVKTEKGKVTIIPKKGTYIQIANLTGKIVFSKKINKEKQLFLGTGIYLVNDRKIIVE